MEGALHLTLCSHDASPEVLEKIMKLPEDKRRKALLALEVDEYCNRRFNDHTVLIRDIPHPAMALDHNGDWIL